MLQALFGGQPFQRIDFDEPFNQILAKQADIIVNVFKFSNRYLPKQLCFVVCSERINALKQVIKEDAQRPSIAVYSYVLSFINYLRCHISWRSAKRFNFESEWRNQTESKIDDFDLQMLIDQDIIGFDITVYNVLIMQISHCPQYLLEYMPSLLLAESSLWLIVQILSQRVSTSVLHDQIDGVGGFKNIVQFGNGRMVDFFENQYFCIDGSQLLELQLFLSINFDRYLAIIFPVDSRSYQGMCSFSQISHEFDSLVFLPYEVFFKLLLSCLITFSNFVQT